MTNSQKRSDRVVVMQVGGRSVSKKGVTRVDWTDPYRLSVSLSWPRFLATLFGLYIFVVALFALAYFAVPGCVANTRPGSFADDFFFSLETLATVGYGEFFPDSLYGHVVAALEICTGLAFTAILTGLTFVRFSRPRAKFVFAEHPIVTTHNGKSTLMLRVGNGGLSMLADARARMSVLMAELSKEGTKFRRTHELALVRANIPVFPLSWTLMHVLDEKSPMHGLDAAAVANADVRLFVSFQARDPDIATVVHAIRDYGPGDVLFNVRYADIISEDEFGQPTADMSCISDVLADP